MRNNWFEFRALGGVNTLFLDDDIGKDGISAKQFKEELNQQRGAIEIHINSAGGVVTEGIAIYNALKAYPGKKTVYIESLAASMASVIAMAGDTITMPTNGLMMIHNPWGVSAGSSKEHRKTADLLDVMKDAMLTAYKSKTDIDEQSISNLMDEETWMNGKDALDLGFIDVLSDAVTEQQINASFQTVLQARTKTSEKANMSIASNVRENASKICQHRKITPPANLFKSQNDKPQNYSEIKNV